MKIHLTTARVGPSLVQSAGDVIDVPADEARRLIDAGQAEPIGRESAALAAPQNAALPQAQPRTRKRRSSP